MADDRAVEQSLAAVWTAIQQLLAELDDKDWDLPTDCPGWSVKDQVSHLIGTELLLLGRTAPAPVEAPHARSPMQQANEGWVAERRERPPADVVAEFGEVTAARLVALRAMTDEQMAEVMDTPIGRVSYEEFMRLRVMDNWVHEQDIRRAVGRPGDEAGPGADAALARFQTAFGFVVGKRAAAPEGSSVVLQLEGPVKGRLAVTVEGGRARVAEPPPSPTVTMTMTAETYSCLSAGRWTAQEALAAGRVKVEGDVDLAGRVLEGMSIMV